MYLPRDLISHLYQQFLLTHTPATPPVLLLSGLDPDALCATRMLSALLKRDFIPHTVRPVSGYADLAHLGATLVRRMKTTEGGDGGLVVCLGVGGLVDLEELLGLDPDPDTAADAGMAGIMVWVLDSRRPWNLSNVFGGQGEAAAALTRGLDKGRIGRDFACKSGIVVFDDGDVDECMQKERDAYCELAEMPELGPELDDDDYDSGEDEGGDDDDDESSNKRKHRALTIDDADDDDVMDNSNNQSDPDEGTPNKRRRSNDSNSIPVSSSTPSPPPSSPPPSKRRRGKANLLILSSQDPSNLSPSSLSSPPKLTSQLQSQPPNAKALRRELINVRRKHDHVLQAYNKLGTSFSEPVSSLLWNLASDLGREDNDLLWEAIVGITSLEISGRTSSGVGLDPVISSTGETSSWNNDRGSHIKAIFRDEVRRLNHPDTKDIARDAIADSATRGGGIIQTHAKNPNDKSIRLSPEPRFLLVRHWSLYDSMLHSPYLSAKLHIWNESGKRKLHKLLAKMGISLQQSKQNYTHMDMDVKRGLGEKLIKYAPLYGLEGLIPPASRFNSREGWGFVRCWGWKACLSALDAGHILGAILEVGDIDGSQVYHHDAAQSGHNQSIFTHSGVNTPQVGREHDIATANGSAGAVAAAADEARQEVIRKRFFTAYDAMGDIAKLIAHIPTAQLLHRAILRTGTSLIEKRQIKRLKPFHIAVVKDGPDVRLFTHPGALIKLALWVAEAIAETEGVKGRKGGELVMAGLDEERGVYVVVGLGGGSKVIAMKEREKQRVERRAARERQRQERKEKRDREREMRRLRLEALGESDVEDSEGEDDDDDDEDDDDDDDEEEMQEEQRQLQRGKGLNRFGNAFQEVIGETGARVKVDNFEHCVVEVKKEDLQSFLESLCMKSVVG